MAFFGKKKNGEPEVEVRVAPRPELKIGKEVVFVDDRCNTGSSDDVACNESVKAVLSGRPAMIVRINEPLANPGKHIALCFKDKIPGGHTCDGLVPAGHGLWTVPEHIYSPAAYEAHRARLAAHVSAQAEARTLVDKYLGR